MLNLCKPEISDLHIIGRREHNVAGLDIAMNHANLVSVVQRCRKLFEDGHDLRERQGPTGANPICQRVPLDKFHHEAEAEFSFAQCKHTHDVGILKSRKCLCFGLESLEEFLVPSKIRIHHLQGYIPVKRHVLRLVHNAHATLAENAGNLVGVDDRSDDGWIHTIAMKVSRLCLLHEGGLVNHLTKKTVVIVHLDTLHGNVVGTASRISHVDERVANTLQRT